MGAGHSEFDEIENAIRKVLHDRKAAQESSSEKESQLKQRQDEYQEDLQQLSSKLEEKENKMKQLKEEVEVARKKAKEATATLRMEINKNISTLREKIQLYHASDSANESLATFNIGLFGNTGVGKTSLLNSMKFAVKGTLEEFAKEQVAPEDFQGGHTTLRVSVGITPFVTFIDNRGIGPEDLGTEGAIEELMRQLEGNASFTKPVDWRTQNQKSTTPAANARTKIFCSILVIDENIDEWLAVFHRLNHDNRQLFCDQWPMFLRQFANATLWMSIIPDAKNARNVKSIGPHGEIFLQYLLRWHGMYPIAAITHVDVATPEEVEDTRRAIKSTGITEVYEVANITVKRPELEVEYQSSLLRLLERCITHCRCTLEYRNKVERAN